MKRRILIFLTALLSIFAATVPSAYASAPVKSMTTSAAQSSMQTVMPAAVLRTDDRDVITDACGNPEAFEGEHPFGVVAGEEIDAEERASSELLPINRWSESTSNFYTNIDEGMFDLNMERMTRENIAGTMFSIASTIWAGTTSTSIWATAFCPIDAMAGHVDEAVGDFGNLLFNEGGAALITLLLIGLIGMALWNSRRGTGFQVAWKELLGKIAVIALLVLMVRGSMAATEDQHGNGLSPANIVLTTNEVVSNLATIASDGLMSISEDAGYAQKGNGSPTLSCQVAVHSLNEMYRTTHMMTDGAGDLAASIPLMLSNSWVETGYMMWMRAQFGPIQGSMEDTPQNHAACYVLDWTSGLPQSSADRSDIESRADLMGTVLRGGYDNGEFASGAMSLTGAIQDAESDVDRIDRQVNRIIAPESAEEEHKAMMFLSICEPGDTIGVNEGFWTPRDGFKDELGLTSEDCHTAWNADDGDTASGDYHPKNLDPFEMPNNKGDVFDELGQGAPMADYVNHVNGSQPIGAVGSAGIMMISSVILFVVFGFISLMVVLVRAALILVIIYLFVMALKALITKDSFQPLLKAAKLLIGTALLAVFVMMLYGMIVAISSLMNNVGSGFMGMGSIPYLLWVTITPGMAILLLHFLFKWAKLPSPMTPTGAKAWGKGLSLDGGDATINAAGGSGGQDMAQRAKRTANNLTNRFRGNQQRADHRDGSREGQMKEERDNQQAGVGTGGPTSGDHAEGSMAGEMSAEGSGGVATATATGSGPGAGVETAGSASAGLNDGSGGPVTAEDKQAVARLRRMEQEAEKKQKRADLMNSLKPRNIGSTMWNGAKNGMAAMKARGVRGNLRKAASTAAKVAGVTTVAGALGLAGGLPLMAAGAAGVVGARAIKRRMEARGLVGRENRATFARDVESYVAAGRPEIGEQRGSVRENMAEQAEAVQQKAVESRAGQWAQDKVSVASEGIRNTTDNVKDTTANYWNKAKTGTASAATAVADTFKPAHQQSGATDEQKDIAYASRHGFDAHDPEQLAAAHDERIKREEEAHNVKAEKQERRGRRAAHRGEIKEHNQGLAQQARSAREAMNQSGNGQKAQKQKPVKLPDAPQPEQPKTGEKSDITGKGDTPNIRPTDGKSGGGPLGGKNS
ncbi:hypothetical protein GCM10009720_21080 [Yaniella flava]|uniref:TrbL/VirB6 plasmid conjugal transfer protein n=1 Tax=Yaniella flava TaxID=287930 RepID=A0ABN2UUC0_9MICC